MSSHFHKCYSECIFYHISLDKTNKPSVKLTCDYRDGIEFKNIPEQEIKNCNHFKTYQQAKQSRLYNKIRL